jgi:glycosyltransferase involved in cell wall biosynthesis
VRIALLLEQSLAPVPGGTGRYAREIAEALAQRPGIEVTGWTAWHRDVSGARVPGVDGPHRLPLGRRPLVVAWQGGLPLPVPGPADLVHAPTLLAPPRGRRPLVVTIHDAVPWTHPETLTPRGVRWHRAMADRVAGSADAVVVPTVAVARALGRSISPRRIVVVGEGARLPTPQGDAAEARLRLDLPEEGFLLVIGTLEPRKGLDVLLRALAEPGAPSLPLLVVGPPGWGDVDLSGMASQLGLADGRVRALGRVSDEDLALLLEAATALVVPSRAEGFGLPVLEGMTAGVPVVTSDDPALVEVGGGATAVAPVGDARALADVLAEVVRAPELRRTMVAAGRTRAAAFGWDHAAGELADLYGELLAARS